MISSLIPFFFKVIVYSIPLCGLIWLYNLIFDASLDVWWGVFVASLFAPLGSKNASDQPDDHNQN